MDKFLDFYRIESSRLKNWDYGWSAYYFVTICTDNRECFFGEVFKSKMILNDLGNKAHNEWMKTPGIRSDMNLTLGEFVVMPNHFHAIIHIGKNKYNSNLGSDNVTDAGICSRDAMHDVSTINPNQNKFGPQSKNLSSIIRGFKSSITTYSRKMNLQFKWQSRFHDRIIRNKQEWYAITNYIKNNPKNWKEDEFYS